MAGHGGDPAMARRGLGDPDAGVQAAALGALARLGELTADDVARALRAGPLRRAPARRRRRTGRCAGRGSRSALPTAVTGALDDPDPLVVVGAAWFLAERRHRPALAPLVAVRDRGTRTPAAARRPWPRSGAIGDPAGLPAVLAALGDKPTVRRRATVALAGFDDPRVGAGAARLRPRTGTGRCARPPRNCST